MAIRLLGELEAKLRKSEEKVGTLEAELRRLRQECEHGAILPKELGENQRLKAKLAELHKKMKEEIEAQNEARTAELKIARGAKSIRWERQEQEAVEELARVESQLAQA